ncbi:hypothetical protein D3C80_1567750 [compost metagenome]
MGKVPRHIKDRRRNTKLVFIEKNVPWEKSRSCSQSHTKGRQNAISTGNGGLFLLVHLDTIFLLFVEHGYPLGL